MKAWITILIILLCIVSLNYAGYLLPYVEQKKCKSQYNISKKGRDLAPGQWNGKPYIDLNGCKEEALQAGAQYFAYTDWVYAPGFCKIQKPSVADPDLSTFQGYKYKLYEKDETCAYEKLPYF